MNFHPVTPTIRVEPRKIAADTYLIHQVQEALGHPLYVYLNSMVILGSEPIIVDTGTIANRAQWLEDVFSLVEPEDVRWIFLSHDDVDHTGNLVEAMTRCPNATLVNSWAFTERNANAYEFPLGRCRWLNDGETFVAGDRRLRAVRPPVWDSPTTRGLLDESTGVYWGVDTFACPMPEGPMDTAAAFAPDFWAMGMAMFVHNAVSPWLSLVDPAKFSARCEQIRSLGMTTIATAHSPVITAERIDKAFEIIANLPNVPAPPVPDQVVLDAILGQAAPAT